MNPQQQAQFLRYPPLHPDGVKIYIPWDDMNTGDSVFIPCINTDKALEQLDRLRRRHGVNTQYMITIENDRYGMRVWRL